MVNYLCFVPGPALASRGLLCTGDEGIQAGLASIAVPFQSVKMGCSVAWLHAQLDMRGTCPKDSDQVLLWDLRCGSGGSLWARAIHSIDHCTSFGPGSACGMTPTSFLVCGEPDSYIVFGVAQC